MKKLMIKIFWPILKFFEIGEEVAGYKKSYRVVLIIVGSLFNALSMGSAAIAYAINEMGALIPLVVFFSVGGVALIVGMLGSDNAVSRIWSRK